MENSLFDLTTIETPTMTKADMAELLFERIGLSKLEAKELWKHF